MPKVKNGSQRLLNQTHNYSVCKQNIHNYWRHAVDTTMSKYSSNYWRHAVTLLRTWIWQTAKLETLSIDESHLNQQDSQPNS